MKNWKYTQILCTMNAFCHINYNNYDFSSHIITFGKVHFLKIENKKGVYFELHTLKGCIIKIKILANDFFSILVFKNTATVICIDFSGLHDNIWNFNFVSSLDPQRNAEPGALVCFWGSGQRGWGNSLLRCRPHFPHSSQVIYPQNSIYCMVLSGSVNYKML